MKEKKRLSLKTWLLIAASVLLLAVLIAVLRAFFVFDGGRIRRRANHQETTVSALERMRGELREHHAEYDSYVIGGPGAVCWPTETLDGCLNARFYDRPFSCADMADVEALAGETIGQYEVRNLVLSVTPRLAADDAAPSVFGDQRVRDVEPIGDAEAYLASPANQSFHTLSDDALPLPKLEAVLESVGRIRALCEERGVRLLVLCEPAYAAQLSQYDPAALDRFYDGLAQRTEYWDFSLTPLSGDARFFYDPSNARPALGRMALARVFGMTGIYVPEAFGRFVAQGDRPGVPQEVPAGESSYTARLPILCYHHLIEEGPCNSSTVTVASFAAQMAALHEAGYTAIGVDELRAYVERGEELPEKPVMITFDDGYESNYTYAFPILRQYGFRATIFAIGVSIGKDSYKDTGEPMTPHFSLEQAKEMEASGLITVASHGYNVHEIPGRDPEPVRRGVLQREGESDADYAAFLTADVQKMFELLGESAGFFAYPNGLRDDRARVLLHDAGVWGTVLADCTEASVLVKGLPQCLYDLPRFHVDDDDTGEALIALLEKQ